MHFNQLRVSLASRVRRDAEAPRSNDRGASALGLLLVVIILGAMVAITLSLTSGSKPVASSSSGTVTTITAPKTVASGASEATLAACEANYASAAAAVSTYRALNGASPPNGVAWATTTTNGGPFLQSWPDASWLYTLTWSGERLSVVPTHGKASVGSFGSSSPRSGCYAVK